jgi:antitoxin Phd
VKETAATEAKNRFGHLLEMAMTEPISIEKKGRPVAVLMSVTEYQRLTELEDRYWGERAKEALESGFLTQKETTKWLKGKMSVETTDK